MGRRPVMLPRRRSRALVATVVLAVAIWAPIDPAQASAQQHDPQGWRDRLIGEFSAAISGPDAPEGICLTLYLNDELVYDADGGEGFVPASILKVATAAVALELMGPDATYTTEVAVSADALAGVQGGVLNGDLYLIGGGDPTLSTQAYADTFSRPRPYTDVADLADTVMASLRSHGIRVVNGAVVGDESRYPDAERDYVSEYLSGQRIWKPSFTGTNLAGPLSALMINDGYHPHRGSRRGHVRPSDPARAAASLFDDLLEARGMVIRRYPRSAEAPEAARRASLGTLASVPMSRIVTRMLAHSDNTTSEMVLKEIGHRTEGSTRAAAAEGAARVLTEMLGDEARSVRFVDGSGLSIHNRMSCRSVAKLLTRAGPGSPLVQALAIAGETGTLRNCAPRTAAGAAANAVRAKSGFLNDTDTLAGVTVASNGDVVTFAMIAHGHLLILNGTCNSLRRALIDAAAGYTYGPGRAAAVFDDMADGVHAPAVQELVMAGIALACDSGGRRFCPWQPIPRSEVAWYLAMRLNLPEAPGQERFADVSADSVYAASIAALAHAGITRGCKSGGRFCPDRSLTRAEAATLFRRAFDLPPAPGLDRFVDVSADSVHAASIAALAHAGITRGCKSGGRFCPDRAVTRAEFATLLSRALRR